MSRFCWENFQKHRLLPSNEIHVFSYALEVPSSNLSGFTNYLSSDELERAQRFKFKKDRMHFIVARAKLRTILSRYLEIKPSIVRFCYGPHGKPALISQVGDHGIRFNISHSHGIAIVAIQLGGEIGVDVEFIKPFPDTMRLADRFFSTSEIKVLSSLPSQEQDKAFFEYWVRKEVIIKLVGQGLSYPLVAFTVSRKPHEFVEMPNVTGKLRKLRRWSVYGLEPCADYVAALATTAHESQVLTWHWL